MWFGLYQTFASHPLFSDFVGVLGFSLFIYCYSVLIIYLCGYLSLLLLRRIGMVRWWTASIAGLAWGSLVLRLFGDASISAGPFLIWGAMGGICGLAFWAVWWRIATQV